MKSIEEINRLGEQDFTDFFRDIFEHSAWIPKKAFAGRPFLSLEDLHGKMRAIVEAAPPKDKLALIAAHPNLGDRAAMSAESSKEQRGAGLTDLTEDEYQRFVLLNSQYMKKFGFPFIMAVKGKNKQEICEAMQSRISSEKNEEMETALQEIYQIARLRLEEQIKTEGEIFYEK